MAAAAIMPRTHSTMVATLRSRSSVLSLDMGFTISGLGERAGGRRQAAAQGGWPRDQEQEDGAEDEAAGR